MFPRMPTVRRPDSTDSSKRGKIIDSLAAVCATAFIFILGIAAYWDPTIRVLHVFESLPYIVSAALCLRRRKFGYMLGAASGAFWLWTAGTLTTFVRNGFERVSMLLRTGHVDRPDILIAAPAALVERARDFLALGLFPPSKQIVERPRSVRGGNGPGGRLLRCDIRSLCAAISQHIQTDFR